MRLFRNFLKLFGWKPKPKRDFPKWAKARCYGALNEMRVVIESKGIRLKEHDITVKVRKADRRYENGWGWHSPELGFAVGAITHSNGKVIEIARGPSQVGNDKAIHYGCLQHEMGHHWLITNGYGGGHDPKFDDVIPGWREARKVTGS